MLALTYPDGARVQRCDYLPENPPIQRLVFDRISLINECGIDSKSGVDYASRYFRRRLRLRGVVVKKCAKNSNTNTDEYAFENFTGIETPSSSSSSCSFPLRGFRCDKSTDYEDDHPDQFDLRASSQSATSRSNDAQKRLSIFKIDDKRSAHDTRRRELPGRESWPGGRHPKDRCCTILQLVLILVLIIIGYNRHCGPFGSRVNRTALGVFAFGTVVGRGDTAPVDIITDTGIRSERSANLSHITGTSRKIQMYIKHRHLQILPDGTVNGSNDDTSDYTVLQRASVSRGQLRIQGVATCLYLCMDSCGLLYGSREYTEDCVFNETLEQHNYNTYSSVHWSTPRKTLYLGLSGRGQPRRVQAKGHNLGRLSAYARVLTQVVAQDRVEALHRRMLGARHNVRHHHGSQQSICPAPTPQEKDGRDKFRCRKRKKRKKRRRKCRPGELPGPQCDPRETGPVSDAQSKRSCEGAAVDEACRKEALETPAKKRKSRIEDESLHQPEDRVTGEDDAGALAEDVVQEDDVQLVEGKTRRSNDRGVKKRGKKSGPIITIGKKTGLHKKGKREKIGPKNERNLTKLLKKRGNHSAGRFARTTHPKLATDSSTAITSPISSWSLETTSPIPILGDSHPLLLLHQTEETTPGNQEAGPTSGLFTDHPKSLSSSSSSAVSAVSLAATSLASTLTLTVAGSAEVFSEDGGAGARGSDATESSLDPEEFVDVKEFDDEDDEERDGDDQDQDQEREEIRTDLNSSGTSGQTAAAAAAEEAERRFAM